jgi:hypothetical protein
MSFFFFKCVGKKGGGLRENTQKKGVIIVKKFFFFLQIEYNNKYTKERRVYIKSFFCCQYFPFYDREGLGSI